MITLLIFILSQYFHFESICWWTIRASFLFHTKSSLLIYLCWYIWTDWNYFTGSDQKILILKEKLKSPVSILCNDIIHLFVRRKRKHVFSGNMDLIKAHCFHPRRLWLHLSVQIFDLVLVCGGGGGGADQLDLT